MFQGFLACFKRCVHLLAIIHYISRLTAYDLEPLIREGTVIKTIANIKLVVRAYFAIVVAGNGYGWHLCHRWRRAF